MDQSKSTVFILEIVLVSSRFSRSLSQTSDDKISTEVRQVGGSTQDSFEKIVTPCTFDVNFPYITRFTFGSLAFAVGED
jgi:hypothetical protein